ncbi:hypothetical protein Pmani_035511 [Petrolisthes manimaculis]|uniref:Condensin-2 complex subunit G2 n=2 Tax=Petrolisthes manimaculis TaxID=1843537 RepID=A0AAE1NMU1_9EUCA|nr:hypothetical protein Pmani_035511 [Petrolisthes manimaculis]
MDLSLSGLAFSNLKHVLLPNFTYILVVHFLRYVLVKTNYWHVMMLFIYTRLSLLRMVVLFLPDPGPYCGKVCETMAKAELLVILEGGQPDLFLTYINKYNKKRKLTALEEAISELSHAQIDSVWSRLHSWVDHQLTLLVAEEDQEQGGSGDATEEQGNNAFAVQKHVNENIDTQEKRQEEGTTKDIEGDDSNCQESGGEKKQQEEIESQRELRGRGNRKGSHNEDSDGYKEKVLESIADFACIYLNTFKDADIYIPSKLLDMAVLLHGLVSVIGCDAQAAVVRLCEVWWGRRLDQCELLISNILLILVKTATCTTAQKKDVMRLWALQKVLKMIDLRNPECEAFTGQLVSCASATVFLSCDEGIKWLASLFLLQHSLIPCLHKGIKSVLPGCTKLQSAKYAQVYFRAWKLSQGETKKVIEEDCLQDLMHAAIHVDPLAGRLSVNLHHFLHHIHRHKRHHSVSTMIYSLYEPILWRSLKVANGLVRMNTIGLLCDAFPLSDATMTKEERSDLMERQYQAIVTLLTDPCHLVRITAVKGTFSVLSYYWLMLPSHIIKKIFQKLISELIHDASSSEVRMQVVKGLTYLLDSRDAVTFLMGVLPRVGEAFDDPSTNVRVAFIKLLLKVKATKFMRYWDIVSVEHLLHRLEEDRPVICQLLTQLLLNSFHPIHLDDQQLVQRSLVLMEENRAASRRFYQYASRKLELSDTVHFMLLLWLCLRSHVRIYQESSTCEEEVTVDSSQRGNSSSTPTFPHNKENASADTDNGEGETEGNEEDDTEETEEGTPLDDPKVIGALLDTVVILWTTIAHKLALPQNFKYLNALRTKVARNMPTFFKFFKNNAEVSQTLLYLSSFLPRRTVPTLVGHCLSRLKTIQSEQESDDSYTTYINALCNWNRADDVLELASEWLEEGFKQGTVTNTKERRKSQRGVHFAEESTSTPQPLIALRLIRHILQHPLNKISTLEKYRHLLLDVTQNMSRVKDLISERLNNTEELSDMCSDQFLCECWAQYLSLVAVLHKPIEEQPPQSKKEDKEYDQAEEKEGSDGEHPDDLLFDSSTCVSECWDWASRVVTPVMSEDTGGGKRKSRSGEEGKAVTTSVMDSLITTSAHIIMTGAANTHAVYKMCADVYHLLNTDTTGAFWQKSLILAIEAHQYIDVYGRISEQSEEDQLIIPVDVVNSVVSCTCDYFKLHETIPKEMKVQSTTLANALVTLGQNYKENRVIMISNVVSTVMDLICWTIDKKQGVDLEVKKVDDLGECSSFLIEACRGRAKLSSAFMESVAEYITSILDTTSLLASTYLIKILAMDSGKISRYNLKEAVVALDSVMSKILFSTSPETKEDQVTNIYEKYGKSAKTILQDLKSSLGVV